MIKYTKEPANLPNATAKTATKIKLLTNPKSDSTGIIFKTSANRAIYMPIKAPPKNIKALESQI